MKEPVRIKYVHKDTLAELIETCMREYGYGWDRLLHVTSDGHVHRAYLGETARRLTKQDVYTLSDCTESYIDACILEDGTRVNIVYP